MAFLLLSVKTFEHDIQFILVNNILRRLPKISYSFNIFSNKNIPFLVQITSVVFFCVCVCVHLVNVKMKKNWQIRHMVFVN